MFTLVADITYEILERFSRFSGFSERSRTSAQPSFYQETKDLVYASCIRQNTILDVPTVVVYQGLPYHR